MKSNQKIKLTTAQTVIYIWVSTVGDGLFDLENKLKEFGIAYTNDYESRIEGACEINLSENMDISQDTWDTFMNYLKIQKAAFQINSRFV